MSAVAGNLARSGHDTMQRRSFLAQSGAMLALGASGTSAFATATTPSVVVQWNRAAQQLVASTSGAVTIAARFYAMLNEAIYNAWAHYDWSAAFTQSGLYKRPWWEWNDISRQVAISHAAHGILTDFYPDQRAVYDPLLQTLIADAWRAVGGWAADDVGRSVAYKVLRSRDTDGSNQRGELNPGAYSDYTNYQPVNTPDVITDLSRWQPLRLPNSAGVLVVQRFLTPHWGRVRPFALASGSVYRPELHPRLAIQAEIDEIIALSAALDDRSKALGDFFAQNPGSVTPPGQWLQIAEMVSAHDCNDLHKDVKLFFTTAQAGLDASIAAWDAKRFHDQSRPITVIPVLYRGRSIRAWGGPGRGTQLIQGENWIPWQRPVNRTPPFPDFVSGHSTFSAAMATALARVRGGDEIPLRAVVPKGAFRTDPGLPAADVVLEASSLSEAADAAGYSRRVTGIHFYRSDFAGRTLGKQVGNTVTDKCLRLFAGIR